MRYILVLLMLGGIAKGQDREINKALTPEYNPIHITDDSTKEAMWVSMGKILPYKSFTDTCQRYRDSVAKYDKNIQLWKRQISPNNPPGYNILLQEKINAMALKREGFVQKAKKCKP